jgi:hypothetical protein
MALAAIPTERIVIAENQYLPYMEGRVPVGVL